MLTNENSEAFIMLKNHKPNFQNNPKVRLINPANNEVGRISKSILANINEELKNSLGIQQWKSTSEVIDWFTAIPDKKNYKFIIFDIKDFYPSISKKLLTDAINFAKSSAHITKEDIRIIQHARKSLLFHDNQTWMKNNGNLFDVTTGVYNGAEVYKLVGIFLQHQISQQYDIKTLAYTEMMASPY